MKKNTNPSLLSELKARMALEMRQLSLSQLKGELRKFGYALERSNDCFCTAQIMTGPRAGETYPQLTLYPIQIDNRRSFAHFQARRDENYKKLQELRANTFAVVRGHIADF